MSEEKRPGRWKPLAGFIGSTLAVGGASAFLTRSSMDIYDDIVKPTFAPPSWCFPVAWSVLYVGMSVAAWLVWREKKPGYKSTTVLYYGQLAVNVAWPLIFFSLRAFGLGFIWLVLLWALIIMLMFRVFRVSRTGGWLLVPYLAWVTFAGALNFMIARLN